MVFVCLKYFLSQVVESLQTVGGSISIKGHVMYYTLLVCIGVPVLHIS